MDCGSLSDVYRVMAGFKSLSFPCECICDQIKRSFKIQERKESGRTANKSQKVGLEGGSVVKSTGRSSR